MVKEYLKSQWEKFKDSALKLISFYATVFFIISISPLEIKGLEEIVFFALGITLFGFLAAFVIESLQDGYKYAVDTIGKYITDIKNIQKLEKEIKKIKKDIEKLNKRLNER